MMIEPESTLEGIGQIADHVSFSDRDLRFIDGQRPGKKNPLNFQSPCTERGADDPIKVIVGDDLFVFERSDAKLRSQR